MLSAYVFDMANILTYSKNIGIATLKSGFLIEGYLSAVIADKTNYFNTVVFSIDIELTELERLKIFLSKKEIPTYVLTSIIFHSLSAIKLTFVVTLTVSIMLFNEFFWDIMASLDFLFWLVTTSLIEIRIFAIGNQVVISNLLPLTWCFFIVNTIVSYLFYLFLGIRGFIAVTIIGALPFWLLSTLLFEWFFLKGHTLTLYIGDFNVIGVGNKVALKFFFDKVTFGFGYLTLSIGLFVLIYSFFYFRGEPTKERLALLLLLFVNSMLILLFSDNLIVTFIGWEFIGVMSFFLINHWSSRSDTLKAALKALAYNLLSDAFLLMAFIMILLTFGSLEISTILIKSKELYNSTLDVSHTVHSSLAFISVFLILGGSIKSAQFFFHTWLPDSMEAPAPASALIHSATLVSAGIFLLARLSPLWFNTSIWLGLFSIEVKSFVLIWGAITAAYGGLVSARQTDLKRILAYSTISHCGYMMVLVGCGYTDALLLYFYIHGLYKALLFLVTGNIMRVYQTQDFRKMGGAWHTLPLETITCIFGFMHLSGAPFSLGYLAKHQVVLLVPQGGLLGYFVLSLVILGACSSVFYSLEFIRCVFFEPDKSSKLSTNSYNKKYYFSKYNNLTGKVGWFVIVTYFTFALLLGNALALVLIEKNTLQIVQESLDFTTCTIEEASKKSIGIKSISTLALVCYFIVLALYVYLTSSNKIETHYPRLNYWMYSIIPSIIFFSFIYHVITTPLVYEAIMDFVFSIFSSNELSNTTIGVSDSWVIEEDENGALSTAAKIINIYVEALDCEQEVSANKKLLIKFYNTKACK